MAECSSLLQPRAMFGRFKANIAEQFTRSDAVRVGQSFQLSPLKRDAIHTAENPGLSLLTILENEEYIGPHEGVERLLDALKGLDLNGIADIAAEYYEEKTIDRVDTADGPVYIEKGLLTSCLRDELTQQNCYELAVYLGLPKKICEDIRKTPMPAEELLKQMVNYLVIADAGDSINVKAFLSALRERGLGSAATLVLCATSSEGVEKSNLGTGQKSFGEKEMVNDALQNELSPQNCYDIAMYFGLPPELCEAVKVSQTPTAHLLQHLHDGGFISDSNVDVFCVVMRELNLENAARALQSSATEKSGEKRKAGRDWPTTLLKCIDKCICDSEDFDEYLSPDNELVLIQCKRCSTEWLAELGSTSSKILSLRRGTKRFQYKLPIYCGSNSRKREEIMKADELNPGDHVVIGGLFGEHSTIVISTTDQKVEVIHWTRNKRQGLMKSIITKKFARAYHIHREFIDIPDSNVWRVVYDKEDPPCVVIARAMKMIERPDQIYCVFDNNCETLATYCKLGKGFSQQGDLLGETLPPVMTWFVKSLH